MLWDNIFNFFMQYVFGGVASDGTHYAGTLGSLYNTSTTSFNARGTDNAWTFLTITGTGQEYAWPLGNYLSLLATIISISIIVILCCLFVYKIIKLIGGLIR